MRGWIGACRRDRRLGTMIHMLPYSIHITFLQRDAAYHRVYISVICSKYYEHYCKTDLNILNIARHTPSFVDMRPYCEGIVS